MTRAEMVEAMARALAVTHWGSDIDWRMHRTDAEAALSAIENAGWAVVPTLPAFSQVADLAKHWGYTIEETAETYEMLIERLALPTAMIEAGRLKP